MSAAGISIGTIAAGVGIAGGINALTGGAITNALGFGPSAGGGVSGGSSAGDPYGPYRAQAAQQLSTLMSDPSQVYAQPGYQQQLQQGMQSTERGLAATGQMGSGREQAALQSLGQSTFSSYYNSLLANLMQLSGASQNPASALQAQTQARVAGANIGQQGLGNIAGGLGQLNTLYGGGSSGDTYSALSNVGSSGDLFGGLGGYSTPGMLGGGLGAAPISSYFSDAAATTPIFGF